MSLYQNFIGIDIGKFSFVTSLYGSRTTNEYENSSSGIAQFIDDNIDILKDSLCVVETTGGYELEFIYSLIERGYKIHRANTRKVKNFIRSLGGMAKTDRLDAKALSVYGKERCQCLELFEVKSKEALALFRLVQRRGDLKLMLVAEKNRLQSPSNTGLHRGIKEHIKFLEGQIDNVTDEIKHIIDATPSLKEKLKVLKTIPGIGDIVASELLILLPELGCLTRRKIAALTGLAPIARDSGTYSGYRRTGHGRLGIKPMLFLAAMAARNSKSALKDFYERLINKGKKKMVALTALMRKIIVIANAKIKDLNLTIKHS